MHIGALRGQQVVPDAFFWGLHVGIFPIWIPVVIVSKKLGKDAQSKQDSWKVVLKDAPDWMRYMVYGFFAYAFVNFAIFMVQAPAKQPPGSPPPMVWRGFSGHWMVFYSAAMAVLYSAANYGKSGRDEAL